MCKFLFGIVLSIFCVNHTPVYATLQEKTPDEESNQTQFFEDVSDCEQAFTQAFKHWQSMVDDIIYVLDNEPYIYSDGFLKRQDEIVRVVDFAPDGVFLSNGLFVYTKDTDYATDEPFRHNNLIYEKVGNYRYITVIGATKAITAVKATSHKTSEINPKTYLKNKNLSCCQCAKQEIGVMIEERGCTTRKSPEGCDFHFFSPYIPYL